MRTGEQRKIVKNVGSSWFALGTNIVVGVFLSPFILHRLGDAAFGIWVLIFSISGYYGIFDLGIRSSVVRFVAKFSATGDRENLARVINTSLFIYAGIGVVTMLVTGAGTFYVDSLFRIRPQLQTTARWLLLIVGTSVALDFPLGVFGGALDGLQRFYLVNWMNVGSTLVRAGLIVLFLHRGYGLLALGLITTILPLMSSLTRAWLALRILQIPLGLSYISRETARVIANYSGATLMIVISSKLRFQTDEMVIGSFLSSEAIAYFSIGARLVDYAGNIILCLAQIFTPMASESDAQAKAERLRKLLIAGNRACAFVVFPISATLIILGKSLIEVWVGARYIPQSYPVLLVLVLPCTLLLAQAASTRMLLGTGQHGMLGIVSVAEGAINLILSILLVRHYGIVGDALGTAIPLSCTTILFMPWYACKMFGVRVASFLKHAYTVPLLATIPLIAALLLEQRWFVPHHLSQLLLHLVIAWGVYGVCFLWMHAKDYAFRIEKDAVLHSEEIPSSSLLQEQA